MLREEVGVYSIGADGIDDRGEKDDIASWRSIDRTYYPKPPLQLGHLPYLLIPPAILMSLIGVPAWLLLRRGTGKRTPA